MPRFDRRQLSTAVLALCAATSLAFAPAVSTESSSAAEQSGRCLEGHGYADTIVGTHGVTGTGCLVPTDCDDYVATGPKTVNGGVADVHYYVLVPRPTSSDPACYV